MELMNWGLFPSASCMLKQHVIFYIKEFQVPVRYLCKKIPCFVFKLFLKNCQTGEEII